MRIQLLTSRPFRIPRYLLARLSCEQYVRRFWWYVAIVPAFGVVAIVLGTGLLQAIGLFAVLWPVTIPARAVFASWRAGSRYDRELSVSVEDGWILFHAAQGGFKLSASAVRRIDKLHGYALLSFGIGQFVAIPLDAFEDGGNELLAALNPEP